MDGTPSLSRCVECGNIIRGDLERCSLCTGVAPPSLPVVEDVAAPPPPARGDAAAPPSPAAGDAAPATAAAPPSPAGGDAAPATAAAPPAAAPHPGLRYPYRPAGTLAISLRMMFTAWLGLEAFALGSIIVLYRMVDAVVANPFAYAFATLDSQFGIWRAMSIVEYGFSAVLVFLFISWTFRAYGNLPGLGAFNPSYGRGFAIGGWFIPIGNLWIPKQIADDIWRSSGGDVRPTVGWRLERVDPRIHLWWASFVLGRVALIFANSRVDEADPQQARGFLVWGIAAELLLMTSAVLAIWFVCTASARQTARAAATGRPTVERNATWRLSWHLAALPVVIIGIAVAGYLVFDVGPAMGDVGTAAGEGTAHYEGYGVSFDYDDSFSAVEQGVIGDTPTEYAGVVLLATSDQKTFAFLTWIEVPDSLIDLEAAVDGLADGISDELGQGSTLRRSEALVLTEGPTEFVAKTFRVDSDLASGSGVVATGMCSETTRGVQMMILDDGTSQIDPPGAERDNPYLQMVIAILSTLDC